MKIWPGLLGAALLLAGWSNPAPVEKFAGAGPQFDPVVFFRGRAHSWGVLENRSGQPTDIVRTETSGEAEGADGLHMMQTLYVGSDAPQQREWHMRRTGPGTFEATANDMVGTAIGTAAGPAFHWQWTLATAPGNDLKNVVMDQWMYLYDDGSMMNRTTVRKLGIVLIEVSERFVH